MRNGGMGCGVCPCNGGVVCNGRCIVNSVDKLPYTHGLTLWELLVRRYGHWVNMSEALIKKRLYTAGQRIYCIKYVVKT